MEGFTFAELIHEIKRRERQYAQEADESLRLLLHDRKAYFIDIRESCSVFSRGVITKYRYTSTSDTPPSSTYIIDLLGNWEGVRKIYEVYRKQTSLSLP